MIDTHCHLTFEPLCTRIDEVLSAAAIAGVDRMITVGTTPPDARRACSFAERFDQVYATVGVHPHYAAEWLDKAAVVNIIRELAGHRCVVALGEMGLDNHYPDPPMKVQMRVLEWQLEVATELPEAGPIIIHNREATDEVLGALRRSGIPGRRFVFHCFTGSDSELDAVLEFGAMVSFTGIVTFHNAQRLAESAVRTPIRRLMVETDSPYLTPEPHRHVRPNEPRYVPCVARFLADQRGIDPKAFIQSVDENAQRVFNLTAIRC